MATPQQIKQIKKIFDQYPEQAMQSIHNTIWSLGQFDEHQKEVFENLLVVNLIADNLAAVIQFYSGSTTAKIEFLQELLGIDDTASVADLKSAIAPVVEEEPSE